MKTFKNHYIYMGKIRQWQYIPRKILRKDLRKSLQLSLILSIETFDTIKKQTNKQTKKNNEKKQQILWKSYHIIRFKCPVCNKKAQAHKEVGKCGSFKGKKR